MKLNKLTMGLFLINLVHHRFVWVSRNCFLILPQDFE